MNIFYFIMKKCYPNISSQYRKIAFANLLKLVIGAVTLTVMKSIFMIFCLPATQKVQYNWFCSVYCQL